VKVVVDTNVIISGIFWSGIPGEILQRWARGALILCVSSDILEEYFEVIERVSIKCKHPELSRRWKAYLFEHCEIFEVKTHNKFIECALSANAQFLVTGDDDLLSLKGIEGVQILKPAEYVKKID
jgi:uncharacterized protein